jgi:hypothetical protein
MMNEFSENNIKITQKKKNFHTPIESYCVSPKEYAEATKLSNTILIYVFYTNQLVNYKIIIRS